MENIFKKQEEFQKFLGTDINSQEFRNQMFYALIAEVVEAANETPWKPWKKKQNLNIDRYRDELADIQIFLINLVLSSGLEWEQFKEIIENKQKINLERQKNDY